MRKSYLLLAVLALGSHVFAQSAMFNKPRVKLVDVIADHKYKSQFISARHAEEPTRHNDRPDLAGMFNAEENTDYRFNKWLWYWQRNTDNNGNLVSPSADWKAFQKINASKTAHSGLRTTSSGLTWTFQGPDSSGAFTGDGAGSGVGRINVVAFHPTDSNTYIIGAPGGGAWKTTNDGHTWTCLTDQLPNLSVGDIRFNPLNGNTIYLCSGDRDANDYTGIGVLKSYDGGTTWNTTGMVWADSLLNIANCILVNPVDTNSLVLGTTAGLYRSYNGGASWTLEQTGNFIQLLYRPSDTNIVYGTTTLNWSGTGFTPGQVFRSANGGVTWSQITSFDSSYRITLAVTPQNPNKVLALVATAGFSDFSGLDGIYSSTDTGHSFHEIYVGSCSGNHDLLGWNIDASDCSGQGEYDLSFAIDPLDSNHVILGGVNAWQSANGGHNWSILSYWAADVSGVVSVHADKHWMAYNPLTPTRFFETNDGGVYSAYHPSSGGTWRNLTNGIGNTEFYGVAVADIDNFVIAGAQDVGSKLVRPGLFEEADGGDGMWSQLDYADSTVGYTSSENGYIDIINPTASQPDLTANDISYNILGGTIEGTGSWVTPFMVEPSCHTCLLAGYQAVYKSGDQGNSWSAISATLSASGNTLSKMAVTAQDSNTIYVAEDATSGSIFYTHDGGSIWNTLSVPYSNLYITDLKIDPRDINHIWVTFGNYGGTNIAEWHSATGWAAFNAGLPDVPASSIIMNKLDRTMYAGTDIGVFYRDSTMSSWEINSSGMPAVRVTDLEINYNAGELWASTYGRGLWRAMLPMGVTNIVPFVAGNIKVMPNPGNGNFLVDLNSIADKTVDLNITDITGKTVWKQNGCVNSGSPLAINLGTLPNGVYVLQVGTGDITIGKQKLVIVR